MNYGIVSTSDTVACVWEIFYTVLYVCRYRTYATVMFMSLQRDIDDNFLQRIVDRDKTF